ncbi:MAG TPA: serine/threonine-protein kinase, partial [Polyangiaceae bacterium]|nr:serine/threonine-protein kinase [Polyangiaceae bacterium]
MAAGNFAGTARFELRRLLGAGGMGVVYAAYDNEHRCEVALKLLPSAGPSAAERIKSEFRLASGLHHPNLVSLAELIEHQEHLFFTMELVSGVDWLSYVRGQMLGSPGDSRQGGTRRDTDTASLPEWGAPAAVARSAGSLDFAAPPVDGARLRSALRQLALALTHLHSHNKVHRDIKPSNVLVSEEGRVVLLDFGLAVDLSRERRSAHLADGTALYMSPEQARGEKPTPASDWYSVGTLLYEAIAGRVPFAGTRAQILADKQARDAELPPNLAPGAPEELRALCLALLARASEERAHGADVLAGVAWSDSVPLAAQRTAAAAPVVGRDEELAAMTRAFEDAVEEPVALLVQGASGVGKTTLLGEFRRKLEASDAHTTIFCNGRCCERESVAFKALDRIVEVLAERHASIFAPGTCEPEVAEAAAMAAQAAALAFPILGRGRDGGGSESRAGLDAWQQQRVAFQGLRDLISLAARRRRLVLCIDDWQWVDPDSIGLLSYVLATPAPPLLLVIATRPGATPPALPCAHRQLVLGNLEPDSAEQLAEHLLRDPAR